MVAAAQAFVAITFVFAFYYLRELNIEHQWRPAGINPPLGFGTRHPRVHAAQRRGLLGRQPGLPVRASRLWLPAATVALLLGLATVVIIAIEIPNAGFRPSNGAYASVFFGWTGFYLISVLGGVYYLETVWARAAARHRRASPTR